MIRVAVVGGAGRMGQVLAHGLSESGDVSVVALVDPVEPGPVGSAEWAVSIDRITPDGVDVVVDFSTPQTTHEVLDWSLSHGVAAVIGTTALDPEDVERARTASNAHIIIAPNYSVSAVLAERFAAAAAPFFSTAEVIELHHNAKIDAPSGTSISVARAIAGARRSAGRSPIADPTERETLPGSRGSDVGDGVRVHAIRMSGLIAHQEVIFGSPGEGLTIRQDSYDRSSYVAGVLLAVRKVRDRPGLTLGLGELL